MAIYKDLLGHSLEKTGAVTVFDATFYDSNDRPLLTLDTLTISNISTDAEQKEIRGGQGADLLMTYDYGRTATVEITDALISMYSLRYLWGAKLKEGDISALVRRERVYDTGYHFPVTADKNAPVTILHKYANGTEEYLEFPNIEAATSLQANSKAKKGDTYIAYYREEFSQGGEDNITRSHVNELTLNSNDFPQVMKLVGETFLIDVKTGKKVAMQIEFPKFKPNAQFTFTLESEGDASAFDFGGQAFAHNGQVFHIRTLGYLDEEREVSTVNPDTEGYNPEENRPEDIEG